MKQNTKIIIGLVTGFIAGYSISRLIISSNRNEDENLDKHEFEVKDKVESEVENEFVPLVEETIPLTPTGDEFPLQLGSEGEKVKRLQIFLMRNLGWVRQPNGKFDLLTEKRTIKFFKVRAISQKLYQEFKLDKMVHDQRLKKAI